MGFNSAFKGLRRLEYVKICKGSSLQYSVCFGVTVVIFTSVIHNNNTNYIKSKINLTHIAILFSPVQNFRGSWIERGRSHKDWRDRNVFFFCTWIVGTIHNPTISQHLRSVRCYLCRSQATVVVRVHKRKSLASNRFYKLR